MINARPRLIHLLVAGLISLALRDSLGFAADQLPDWTRSAQFAETSFTVTLESKIRIHVNAPLDEKVGPARGTRLIVYALPAGNTIEQTLGCRMKPDLDWHYDIQHVAAQVRQ